MSGNDKRMPQTMSTIINPYANKKRVPVYSSNGNQSSQNDKRQAQRVVTIINPYAKKKKIPADSASSRSAGKHQKDVSTIRPSSITATEPLHQTKQGTMPQLRPQEGFKRTPQSQVLTFGSATICTVSEVASSLEEKEVRVTGRWIRGYGTATDWLQDPLQTTTDIRIRLCNPVEPCLSETSKTASINDNTLLTVFGRLANGAITVRLAVVNTAGTLHMGLYQQALMARRQALGQLVEKQEEPVDEHAGFAFTDNSM